MLGRIAAFGIHAFTALGVVLGFQALIAAAAHRWEAAFAWLGLALVVDGIDGPLARGVSIGQKLPRFSGERLDLIIDYFTYVVVPAYIIYEAQLMPEGFALVTAAIILLTSLFHFIDRESKTEDGFFVGFPALWNFVALYLLLFAVGSETGFVAICTFAVLTFFPLKWVHPVRVKLLRAVTLAVIGLWGAAIAFALWNGLPASLPVQMTVAVTTLYLMGVGLLRSFRKSTGAGSA